MADYVVRTDSGVLRIAGTRVSLASIVHCFWRGETPEEILHAFPTLGLEQIYGVIAYYLRNREAVDRELAETEERVERLRGEFREENRALREKLLRARDAPAR